MNSVKSWAYSVDWGRFGIGLAKGLGAVALLVGGIAVIGATGGAALPVVVGSLSSTAILWATQILGAATIAFGLSDLMEAAQDIANSLVSPETGSINPLRDKIFGMLGINPEDYYIIEALVGSAATAGASVVNAFALSGQAISIQDYISNKTTASTIPSNSDLHNAVSEWTRMEKSLANSKRQLDKFNTATVVYDSKTGNYYYGMNRGVQLSGEGLNPSLAKMLPETSLNQYRVGNCAEVDAVNQALNAGANIDDLYMYTINAKTGASKPMCENCTYTFSGKVADILTH